MRAFATWVHEDNNSRKSQPKWQNAKGREERWGERIKKRKHDMDYKMNALDSILSQQDNGRYGSGSLLATNVCD